MKSISATPEHSPASPGSRVGGQPATRGRSLAALALFGFLVCLLLGCPDPAADGSSAREGGVESIDSDDLAVILQSTEMLDRVRRVAAYLDALSPSELEATRDIFEKAALDRGDIEYALFGDWWGQFDPKAAFLWTELNMKTRHPRTIASVVRAWARKDPEAARESAMFYSSGVPPLYRVELLDALVVGWFDSGKPGLIDFMTSLTQPGDLNRALQTYARRRVIRDGRLETLEWARDAPEFTPAQHRTLLGGALTVVAMQDPELAAEWVPILEADGVDTAGYVLKIAVGWSDYDPGAALRWLGTQSDSNERTFAVTTAGGLWFRKDRQAALDWLATKDAEAWIDPFRSHVVRQNVQTSNYHADWNEQIREANKIIDEERRTTLMVWLSQRWMILDEENARPWIEGYEGFSERLQIKALKTPPFMRERVEAAYALGPSGSEEG